MKRVQLTSIALENNSELATPTNPLSAPNPETELNLSSSCDKPGAAIIEFKRALGQSRCVSKIQSLDYANYALPADQGGEFLAFIACCMPNLQALTLTLNFAASDDSRLDSGAWLAKLIQAGLKSLVIGGNVEWVIMSPLINPQGCPIEALFHPIIAKVPDAPQFTAINILPSPMLAKSHIIFSKLVQCGSLTQITLHFFGFPARKADMQALSKAIVAVDRFGFHVKIDCQYQHYGRYSFKLFKKILHDEESKAMAKLMHRYAEKIYTTANLTRESIQLVIDFLCYNPRAISVVKHAQRSARLKLGR